MDHEPLSYALWRATKYLPDPESKAFVAACIANCADECFKEEQDPRRNELSSADNNSRSLSIGSHQSHGSAVKHEPPQAPANLGSGF